MFITNCLLHDKLPFLLKLLQIINHCIQKYHFCTFLLNVFQRIPLSKMLVCLFGTTEVPSALHNDHGNGLLNRSSAVKASFTISKTLQSHSA